MLSGVLRACRREGCADPAGRAEIRRRYIQIEQAAVRRGHRPGASRPYDDARETSATHHSGGDGENVRLDGSRFAKHSARSRSRTARLQQVAAVLRPQRRPIVRSAQPANPRSAHSRQSRQRVQKPRYCYLRYISLIYHSGTF